MGQNVKQNPRLLFWGRAFVGAKFLSAIMVLFYMHRGLTLNEVFMMSIVWSITSLLLEVPSGYLADRIGRKRTILLGTALLLLAYGVKFVAQGFWPFAAVFFLMSASFSCYSGTMEALLYESLVEMGRDKEMNAQNGKQLSARALAAIFLPAIGAFIAHDLTEPQFQVIIILNMLFIVAGALVFSRLIEPKRIQSVSDQEISVFRESIKTIRRDPWLLKVALNKLIFFIAIFISWRVSQPFLEQFGFGAEALGIFYVFFQGLEFLASWFTGAIEKKVGTARIIALTPIITSVALLVVIWSSQPWVVFICFGIAIASNALREPVFAHAVNQRIASRSRATTLSNMNVIKGLLDIPVLLLAGWLSSQSLEYTLMLAIALSVLVLIALPIRKSELQAA